MRKSNKKEKSTIIRLFILCIIFLYVLCFIALFAVDYFLATVKLWNSFRSLRTIQLFCYSRCFKTNRLIIKTKKKKNTTTNCNFQTVYALVIKYNAIVISHGVVKLFAVLFTFILASFFGTSIIQF